MTVNIRIDIKLRIDLNREKLTVMKQEVLSIMITD